MYKVFNQDRTIIFTQNVNKFNLCDHSWLVELASTSDIPKVYKKFQKEKECTQLVFICKLDVKVCFKYFKSQFRPAKAAGGFVKNQKGELLMIYRLGNWDLPKGKLDDGETKKEAAIRECEEETGVKGLVLHKKLGKTYHIFKSKSKNLIFKTSHWYEMTTSSEKKLKPQLNEDITKAKWMSKEQVEEALDNTYPSLVEIIKLNL